MNASSYTWWMLITFAAAFACDPGLRRGFRIASALVLVALIVLHFVTYPGRPCRFFFCGVLT